jgi:hypothetical protein
MFLKLTRGKSRRIETVEILSLREVGENKTTDRRSNGYNREGLGITNINTTRKFDVNNDAKI